MRGANLENCIMHVCKAAVKTFSVDGGVPQEIMSYFQASLTVHLLLLKVGP